MKQLLTAALCAALFAACSPNSSTATTDTDKKDSSSSMSSEKVSFPYTATYSSSFEIGDSKYAQTVLKLWKDYDNNTLNDNSAFADSVSMDFPDGGSFHGTKDSFLHMTSKYRGSLKSAVDSVSAFVVLKPKDKEGNWACIWGTEYDVLANGKKDTTYLNENWHFTKADKVDYISQFSAGKKK